MGRKQNLKPLTDEQWSLVVSVLPMIKKFAYRFTPELLRHNEEKVQETYDLMFLRVCNSARLFEKDKGFQFTTYAMGNLSVSCWSFWQAKGRMKRVWSVDSEYEIESETMSSVGVFSANIPSRESGVEPPDFAAWEVPEAVNRVLNFGWITDRERRVLELSFGIGGQSLPYHRIADLIGVSTERVRQIKDEAIKKIRKVYAESCRENLLTETKI